MFDLGRPHPFEIEDLTRMCFTRRAPKRETVRASILVADDHHDSIVAYRTLFSSWGYDVETCTNGNAAIAAVRRRMPDFVFLDINLAGMNGYDVAKRIRETPSRKRPSLIALTGHGGPEREQLSLDAGFDLHLVKPVDPEILRRILSKGIQ